MTPDGGMSNNFHIDPELLKQIKSWLNLAWGLLYTLIALILKELLKTRFVTRDYFKEYKDDQEKRADKNDDSVEKLYIHIDDKLTPVNEKLDNVSENVAFMTGKMKGKKECQTTEKVQKEN